MAEYILTRLSGDGVSEPFEPCAARKMRGESKEQNPAPVIDLLVITDGQDTSAIKNDSDFFVFGDAGYSFQDLESWMSRIGLDGHGVVQEDTAKSAAQKIDGAISSGQLSAVGIEVSALISDGDIGDYYDTTDVAGKKVSKGFWSVGYVKNPGDPANRIYSQLNSNFLSCNVDHIWTDNAIADDVAGDDTTGRYFGGSIYPTFGPNASGLTFSATIYHSGTNSAQDDKEYAWLRNHSPPSFGVATGDDRVTGKYTAGISHRFPRPSPSPHSYTMTMDPASMVVKFFYDGQLDGQYDVSAHVQPSCTQLALVSGVRNGIESRFWRVMYVNKPISDGNALLLHNSMVNGCRSL